MSRFVGPLVVGVIVAAMVVMLVLGLVALVDMLGSYVGLWHAPCALIHHQPQCRGWH